MNSFHPDNESTTDELQALLVDVPDDVRTELLEDIERRHEATVGAA